MACWPRWQPDCSLVAQFVSRILWLMSVLCESHSNNKAILQKDERPWPLTPGLKSVVSTGPQCRRKPLAFLVPLQKIQKSILHYCITWPGARWENREIRCAIRQVLLCLNRLKKTKLIWLWMIMEYCEYLRMCSLVFTFAMFRDFMRSSSKFNGSFSSTKVDGAYFIDRDGHLFRYVLETRPVETGPRWQHIQKYQVGLDFEAP